MGEAGWFIVDEDVGEDDAAGSHFGEAFADFLFFVGAVFAGGCDADVAVCYVGGCFLVEVVAVEVDVVGWGFFFVFTGVPDVDELVFVLLGVVDEESVWAVALVEFVGE